jgi:hypothetical protein
MPSESTNILNLVGNVTDPTQTAQPDGGVPPFTSGGRRDLHSRDTQQNDGALRSDPGPA